MYLLAQEDKFASSNSVLWGPSPLNQPIENHWVQFLGAKFESYWIEEVQEIKSDGLW